MNRIKSTRSLMQTALALVVLALAAGPSFAVELAAVETEWTAPDGTKVPMWDFIQVGQAANFNCATVNPTTPWDVGPQVAAVAGANLTINLKNCLTEPVSIVIMGQAATGAPVWADNGRLRSFAPEAAAGGTVSYTWNGLKAGTYLYQSGTHPAKQVQMGLYGAVKVDTAPFVAYSGVPYDNEVVLLYSEIDADLHSPPGVAQPLNYIPEYYLINGQPHQFGSTPILAGNVNETVLIRFLNAGLKTHVPTLLNAPYMSLVAEDGNLSPYAKAQYSVLLAAGKTIDAIWTPTAGGKYPLVDRSNSLTNAGATGGGMLTYLGVP